MCATSARLAMVPASLYAGKKMDRLGRVNATGSLIAALRGAGEKGTLARTAREGQTSCRTRRAAAAGPQGQQRGRGHGAEREPRRQPGRAVAQHGAMQPRSQAQ